MNNELYVKVHQEISPPLFLAFFTLITQVLVVLGNPEAEWSILGSVFAWKVVLFFYFWGFLSLKVPGPKFYGPVSPDGDVPEYATRGTQYFLVSNLLYLSVCFFKPDLCLWIYEDFSSIIAVLNLTALALCAVLFVQAKPRPGDVGLPKMFLYYRGVELHPRILDVDVKQWTNCRVGMLGWSILVTTFCIASNLRNGFAPGPIAHAILLNLYLLKFFYWETGYFNTLDITLDRAGYYLCWGCLCWVQVFYTFCAYYLVYYPSQSTLLGSLSIVVFGLLSLTLNYMADYQKEKFKANKGRCFIWGKPAKYLEVETVGSDGRKKKSTLLLSGFWGMSRHMNYVFELMLAFTWSLPGFQLGIWPFLYFIFLLILLVHRTFRDDKKCQQKYGAGWNKYCLMVPYKMIPYVF
ncbi:hypothetical protein TCAL_03858 [Tigriopus californicus]|uniref:7-dehydrocholesterol reductase n=1 Tax=Tigriopus californicus TaxID=6832 RepID=A0A553PH76_TIGCA|nr:uncharacterized protein LOC131881295 [Tigriopus californicus]TRY77041.1 hypothetical protein TCAL_03858 [Tigriopus californicus]|eukprot:TCALIF_03858-PA protein Name:"Similar to DWF5 7-dehydrocholesterol reductase (Arabidopsis thaliana)" AED:0.03 eAED:0.03 QI:379/1/1/1/1/1/3/39/406